MVFSTNPEREPLMQVGYRLKKNLVDYIKEIDRLTGGKHGGPTRVVEDALKLHRAMFHGLGGVQARLTAAAKAFGMDWPEQENEILLELIKRGLDEIVPKKK